MIGNHLVAALLAVAGLVVLDWLMGVLASIRAGTFSFHALPRQLETTVLPVIGGLGALLAVQVLSSIYTDLGPGTADVFYAACATTAPKYLLDIVAKTQALLGGSTPAPPAAAA